MQNTFHQGVGDGGGVFSGESMSTLSREENNMVLSSEESSSYPDESELELGLGLTIGGGGGGGGGKGKSRPAAASGDGGYRNQYARILTAKDFPSGFPAKTSCSSSSSSSVTKSNYNNGSCGTKRAAEPSSPPGRSSLSQVVGWPPVRTYRMNSLANQAKSPITEDFFSKLDKCKSQAIVVSETDYGGNPNNNISKAKGHKKTSLFVKVNMDGIPIGRKVDLNAHSCYETLAQALGDMFRHNTTVSSRRSNVEEQVIEAGMGRPVRLFDNSSDFVLTYEDKEGDWMLVGDVPWEMFMTSVRRLRIMRRAEASGLAAPRSHEMNGRQLPTST